MITSGERRRLGVPAAEARLRFEAEQRETGGGPGRRLLVVDGEPSFELSFWCGTCPFLFRRLETAGQTLSLDGVRDRLTAALADPDDGGVIDAFAALLPEGEYLPVLLRVEPRLVVPGKEGDYFSGEQVVTWGLDQLWGLPQFGSPDVEHAGALEQYVELMGLGTVPTAVAVSTLDVCEPASGAPADHYQHWGLTHFLLDGHHKLEAAATAGRPVQLLSLLALGEGLAEAEHYDRLPALRAQPRSARTTGH